MSGRAPDGEFVSSKHNRAIEMLKARISQDEEMSLFAHCETCYHEYQYIKQQLLDRLDQLYWK